MKRVILGLFVILAFVSVFAESLIIVTEEYPPFNYTENNKVVGISTEVVNAVLKELKMNTAINVYPWARAYDMALKGQDEKSNKSYVLIFSIGRIPEREKLFKWVGVVAPQNVYFWALADRKDIKISKLDDAKKYKIGVVTNDLRELYLKGKGFNVGKELDETSSNSTNLVKLMAGRIDLLPESDVVLPELLKNEKIDPSKLVKVFKIDELSKDGYYMAFSPNTPNDYVAKFKAALDKIKKDGTYDKIMKKYVK